IATGSTGAGGATGSTGSTGSTGAMGTMGAAGATCALAGDDDANAIGGAAVGARNIPGGVSSSAGASGAATVAATRGISTGSAIVHDGAAGAAALEPRRSG